MKIRLVFKCSRCGSNSFRPSTKWAFKDSLLRRIGVAPQRCFRCRGRFYLYRPVVLQSFLRALAGPAAQEAPVARQTKVAKAGTDVLWSTFAETEQRKGRS